MNQQNRETFFDSLILGAQADSKNAGKWVLGMGTGAFAVALILQLMGDMLAGVLFFCVLGIVMLVVFAAGRKSAAKLKTGTDGDLEFLEVYGTDEKKQALVRKLNEEWAAGKALFSKNDKNMRAYVFPKYLVFSYGATITVISEDKLYWSYVTIHKKNGVETDRIISFYTDREEVTFSTSKREDAEELIRQMAIHYQMWVGFDNSLKNLYSENRKEFIQRMDGFKWYKKTPV